MCLESDPVGKWTFLLPAPKSLPVSHYFYRSTFPLRSQAGFVCDSAFHTVNTSFAVSSTGSSAAEQICWAGKRVADFRACCAVSGFS